MADKKELDELIAKAGIGPRSAKKLHEANGTADTKDGESTTPRRGGTGASRPQLPNFGDI